MRKHTKKLKIHNALDFPPNTPIRDPFLDVIPFMPESSSEDMGDFPEKIEDPAKRKDFQDMAYSVDFWPEIKKKLTAREFQAFELAYRYQMPYTDISKIMNINPKNVYQFLNLAKKKMRKTFDKRPPK